MNVVESVCDPKIDITRRGFFNVIIRSVLRSDVTNNFSRLIFIMSSRLTSIAITLEIIRCKELTAVLRCDKKNDST